MTRENQDATAQAGEVEPATKKSPLMLVALIVVGLAVGAASGWLVLAPKVLASGASATADGADGDAKKRAVPAAAAMHQLENLVVNPAETQGTRFLVATVALETEGAVVVDELERRDVKVRDTLLRVLGSRTVAQLSDLAERELLKTEISAALSALLVTGKVTEVYFPQFVIQ